MLIKKPADILYSEITPKHIYMNRRNFLAGVPAAFLGARELLSPSGRTRIPPTGGRAERRPSPALQQVVEKNIQPPMNADQRG